MLIFKLKMLEFCTKDVRFCIENVGFAADPQVYALNGSGRSAGAVLVAILRHFGCIYARFGLIYASFGRIYASFRSPFLRVLRVFG